MKLSREQVGRLRTQLEHDAGSILCAALQGLETEDLVLNPDGLLWEKTKSGGWKNIASLSEEEAYSVVNAVASIHQRELSDRHPVLETTFPLDDSRFSAVVPPVVRRPIFALRLRKQNNLRLKDYVVSGVLTHREDPLNAANPIADFASAMQGKSHVEIIQHAVISRKNVMTVGPTGSGKTSLSDTILSEIGLSMPNDRIITIEDTAELFCDVLNSVDLLASGNVSMLDCLKIAMRLRPKRIVVGEVRGPEAHALLKAWNTGHPGGIATIHADDAYQGLVRLESLVAESTHQPQQDLIAQAVDLVIFIEEDARVAAGRKVREVLAVTGYDRSAGRYRVVKL